MTWNLGAVRCGTIRLGDEQWNGIDDEIGSERCAQHALVRLLLKSSWLTNASLLMLKADPQMPLKIYPIQFPVPPQLPVFHFSHICPLTASSIGPSTP
jgi:hypothetical protein